MKSPVYFCPIQYLPEKLATLVDESGVLAPVKPGLTVGIKIHFGEEGNKNFIPPGYVKEIIKLVKKKGGKPVLVETTTLYRGRRQNAESHKQLAYEHGFSPQKVSASIRIVDGKRGGDYVEAEINMKHVKRAKIGKGISDIDVILSVAHVKGHMLTGFGGTIKNLGMGLAAKGGKLEMHSTSKPKVAAERCDGCQECVEYCPNAAITLKNEKACIDYRDCVGCAGCLAVCPKGAIRVAWADASEPVQEKLAEYCYAVLRKRKAGAINFLINITPNCDCYNVTEKPFMADVGVLASPDPVACDQAALDRIATGLAKIYPAIDSTVQLEYCERLGLGNRDYQLITL
jgi:uncharacterized Fe-S center protein